MGARLEHDPGEDHGLAGLGPEPAREGRSPFDAQVLADALTVLEGAVLAPDLAGLLCHPAVGVHVLLRHRQDVAIDISSHAASSRSVGSLLATMDVHPRSLALRLDVHG